MRRGGSVLRLGDQPLAIKDAYYHWIAAQEVEWTLFGTLTLGVGHATQARVRKLAIDWLWKLSHRTLRGRCRGRMVPAVFTVEQHRSGEPHVHLAVEADVNPTDAARLWKKDYGIAKVEAYDHRQDGLRYILKSIDHGADVWVARETFQRTA